MKRVLELVVPVVCKLLLSIVFIISLSQNWHSVMIISFSLLIFMETLFFLFKKEKNAVTTLDQMIDNISYQFPIVLCVFGLTLIGEVKFWILVVYVLMYVLISLIYYYLHLVSVRTITNTTLHLAIVPLYLAILLSIVNVLPISNSALSTYAVVLFILGLAIYAVGFILFIVKYAHYFKFRRRVKERNIKLK